MRAPAPPWQQVVALVVVSVASADAQRLGSVLWTRNASGVGLQAIAQCWTSFDVIGDYSHAFQLQGGPVQWMPVDDAAFAVGPANSSTLAVGEFSASRMFLNSASAFVALVADSIASPLNPQSAPNRAAELTTPTWDEAVNKLPLPWTATLYPESFDAMPLICVWCDRWSVRVRPLNPQRPADFSVALPVDSLQFSFPATPLLVRYRPRIRLSCAPTRVVSGWPSEDEPGWLAGPHVVTSGCEYTGLGEVTLLLEASAAVGLGVANAVFGEESATTKLELAGMLSVSKAGDADPMADPPFALTGATVLVPGRVFLVTLTPRLGSEGTGWPLDIRIRAGSVPGADNIESAPLRLGFRFSSRWLLPHRLEGHAGGLIWFLGTTAGTSRWRNPAQQATCEATAGSAASTAPACLEPARSSRGASLDTDACIASRGSMACYTADEPQSWWSLSLPPAAVLRVRGYEIRDGEDQVRQHLTSWELQARDAVGQDRQWRALASHPDEPTALVVDRGLARFSIPPSNATPALQSFRVLQTGPNSRGANDFGIAGIELFGELFLRGDPCAGLSCGAPDNGTCVRLPVNDTSLGTAIPLVPPSPSSGFASPGVQAAATALQGAACRCLGGYSGPDCSLPPGARRNTYAPPTDSRISDMDTPGIVVAPSFTSVLSPAEVRAMTGAEQRRQAMRGTGDGFPPSAFGCLGTLAPNSSGEVCTTNPVDAALDQAIGPHSLIGSGILGAIIAGKLHGFGPEAYPAPRRLDVWWEPANAAPFVDNLGAGGPIQRRLGVGGDRPAVS
ncbi:hypothetical protein FNF28_04468 [Cafeteria roenbergensis]|uniref:EGF-like domain-containing protein n=1 Tax=Cafeteria roenbergensis TaxID=33653 RepID=A0A5A8DBF5_CAFRO|nr:hypothetical protein FNF28_04468 [Cafeteria roenbergensis]